MSIVYVQKQIAEVIINPQISLRGIDDDHVQDLMHAQLEYGESEWQDRWQGSLIITEDSHVVDGHHTLEAAKINFGENHAVKFEVRGKTFRDAFFLATGTNAAHGKRRSNGEKRSAVLRWLEDDEMKEWTDGSIAKHCYVAPSTITRISDKLLKSTSYTRPTKRKYLDKSGSLVWIETNKIGNGSETSPQSELLLQEALDAAKSEELIKEWVDISLKVDACIASLDLKHILSTTSIHRLNAPRETVAWTEDADYAKGVDDAQAWLAEFENPDPTCEMALMLEELKLINEIFEIYKPLLGDQLHIDMLSTEGIDAKAAVLSLRSADWESQDRSVRIEHLHDLKDVFAHVSEFEEKARDAREEQVEIEKAEEELHQARCDAEDAKCDLFETFKGSGLSKHINLEEFTVAAAKAFNCYKPNDEKSGEYYIVGEHVTGNLTLKEAQQWKARFEAIKVAIEQKAEWIQALFPQPQLDEPDPEQAQSDHVEQLRELPAEIRDYIPKWIRVNPIREAELGKYEDEITLKLLLDARCQIEHGRERGADPFFKEEMEDLLNRMKTSDEALIAKVYELVAGEQDPSSDEWNEKWLPLLVDVFEGHAVKYVAVSIDQAVIQDYGSLPWKLSVEDLKRLISDAKTVIGHAKTPQVAWKRNRGKEDISWALKVLGLDQKEDSGLNSEDVDTSNALAVVEFKVTAHGKATVIPGVSITDGTITNDEFDEILYSLEEDLKRHLAANGIVVRG